MMDFVYVKYAWHEVGILFVETLCLFLKNTDLVSKICGWHFKRKHSYKEYRQTNIVHNFHQQNIIDPIFWTHMVHFFQNSGEVRVGNRTKEFFIFELFFEIFCGVLELGLLVSVNFLQKVYLIRSLIQNGAFALLAGCCVINLDNLVGDVIDVKWYLAFESHILCDHSLHVWQVIHLH